MPFAERCTGSPLPRPLLWRVFLTNAAVLTAAMLALAFSPATVSFPLAVTEAVVLGGGLAGTLALDLLMLRRVLGSAAPTALAAEVGDARPRAVVRTQRGLGRRSGTRLLVCWSRPYHLSDADAAAWAESEVRGVLAATGTQSARLTRLCSASARYHRPSDWLLELELAPQSDVREYVESPAWRGLLGDLRQLETRPAAMVAGPARVISGEPSS